MLVREPGVLYVSRGEGSLPSDAWPQMPPAQDSIAVVVPGRMALAAGWQDSERLLIATPGDQVTSATIRTFSKCDWMPSSLPAPLELRARRPGDTFEPLGLHGHSQKLSDFFVNEKLPARARARWPLLCEGDSIAWIPGFRPAGGMQAPRPDTQRAIRLEVSRTRVGAAPRLARGDLAGPA